MYLCLYPLNSEGWVLRLGLHWPHSVCRFQFSESVFAACAPVLISDPWHSASWAEIKMDCWAYLGSAPELLSSRVLMLQYAVMAFSILFCSSLEKYLNVIAIGFQHEKGIYLQKIMEGMVNPLSLNVEMS